MREAGVLAAVLTNFGLQQIRLTQPGWLLLIGPIELRPRLLFQDLIADIRVELPPAET